MRRSTALFTFALALGAAIHTPGADAQAPAPITACGTINEPGSYMVATNLTAAGDCLVVTADFVTIDLAGFVITGNGTGSGIRGGPRSTAVRNGTIVGFAIGVNMGEGIVEGVRALANTREGIRTAVAIVRGNFAERNGGLGILAAGIVSGNEVFANGGQGIFAGGASTVSGNNAVANGAGISAGAGSIVSGNTAVGNDGTGIRVGCPSNVIGNTATTNVGGNLVLGGEGCNNIDNLAP